MKIRPFPAVISLVIALVVLFGGWFGYEWFAVKQPVRQLLENEAHVSAYEIDVTPRNVTIDLEVTPEFSLTRDFLVLLEQVKAESGQENVTLALKDDPDDQLQTTWHDLYFVLAEGIANREYNTMLEQLQRRSLGDVELQVAMDAEHLYVWLQKPNAGTTLFRALPLYNGEAEVDAHA